MRSGTVKKWPPPVYTRPAAARLWGARGKSGAHAPASPRLLHSLHRIVYTAGPGLTKGSRSDERGARGEGHGMMDCKKGKALFALRAF